MDPKGPYIDQQGIDPWTADRDARLYDGRAPVVVHSPCAPWGRYAGIRGPPRGQDDGCAAHGVRVVRSNGGVFEHPEGSAAFDAFGLPRPPVHGWSRPDAFGGRTIAIDQGLYGHRARKRTWLYAVLPTFPELAQYDNRPDAVPVENMGKLERRLTPPAFRDLLVSMARSCAGWTPTPQLTLEAFA